LSCQLSVARTGMSIRGARLLESVSDQFANCWQDASLMLDDELATN